MAKEMIRTGRTIAEYKTALVIRTKKRTSELIAVGFTFDSKQFPADLSSNFNYDILKNNPLSFVWPKNIGTVTGETYSLKEIDIDTFWLAAKNFIEPILEGNRGLINSIATSTIDELKLITDDR